LGLGLLATAGTSLCLLEKLVLMEVSVATLSSWVVKAAALSSPMEEMAARFKSSEAQLKVVILTMMVETLKSLAVLRVKDSVVIFSCVLVSALRHRLELLTLPLRMLARPGQVGK
jgi:hypothetical protein